MGDVWISTSSASDTATGPINHVSVITHILPVTVANIDSGRSGTGTL